MASRRVPGRQLDALLPQDRLPLLSRALARGGGGAALRPSDGISVSVSMQGGLTKANLAEIKARPQLVAMLARMLRSEGGAGVRRLQKLTRDLDTIDTKLLLSSWGFDTAADQRGGLKTQIRFFNTAPYTMWVHPKKDKKKLVGYYVKRKVLPEIKRDLIAAVKTLKPRIAAAVKNEALAQSRKDARKRKTKAG